MTGTTHIFCSFQLTLTIVLDISTLYNTKYLHCLSIYNLFALTVKHARKAIFLNLVQITLIFSNNVQILYIYS